MADSTKRLQANWIGRSEGAKVSFAIEDNANDTVRVFTRPDTLFKATYGPDSRTSGGPVDDAQREEVDAYIAKAKN